MGNESNGMDRDNLSSISTILGLSLFCFLVATIIVRKVMIHRQHRRFAQERFWAATAVMGNGPQRGAEDDEPRTIAIGARASLLKRPIIWENHMFVSNRLLEVEKRDRGSCWDHLQPTALQLLSPHTTAHFPKLSPTRNPHGLNTPNRIARAYSHFLFHRDHMAPPTTTASVDPPGSAARERRRSSQSPHRPSNVGSQRAPTPSLNEDPPVEDGTYPHPVHLTFLITMPDPSSPSYTNVPLQGTSSQPTILAPLALGTTQPTARLPSILIPSNELDSWWNLPPSSPVSAGFMASGLTAGQMLQLEIARERAEREAQRMRILHVGFGGAVRR